MPVIEGDGFGLDTSHGIAATERQWLSDGHDQARAKTGPFAEVIHIHGAPAGVKKLGPEGHRRRVNDDVTVRMRTELERRIRYRERPNVPTGTSKTKRIVLSHAADIDRRPWRLRSAGSTLSSGHLVRSTP